MSLRRGCAPNCPNKSHLRIGSRRIPQQVRLVLWRALIFRNNGVARFDRTHAFPGNGSHFLCGAENFLALRRHSPSMNQRGRYPASQLVKCQDFI